MFYVIGQEKYRNEWLNEHDLPHFEFEELQDKNTFAMWNSKNDDAVALIVDLVPFGQESYNIVYTVALYDDETGCYGSEADYSTYKDAYQAYCQINYMAYPF